MTSDGYITTLIIHRSYSDGIKGVVCSGEFSYHGNAFVCSHALFKPFF